MNRSLHHYLELAVLIITLIMAPMPAEAFPVFDITAYGQRVKSELNRLKEWEEKVRQYQQMYQKAVEQYTTMKGILETVDKTLAQHRELALLTHQIGEIIRDSYDLKRRGEAMVKYQIQSLESIRSRLDHGILDPDADRRDFENYLLYSMGRSSDQTVRMVVQEAQADGQLTKWNDEKKQLYYDLGIATGELEKQQALLVQARQANADPANINPLIEAINQKQALIAELKKQIKEIEEKIAKRVNEYGIFLEDMENFGWQVEATNQMWSELQNTKDDLTQTFDRLILEGSP